MVSNQWELAERLYYVEDVVKVEPKVELDLEVEVEAEVEEVEGNLRCDPEVRV